MASRFSPARVHFGRTPPDDFTDDGTGLPTPIRTKAAARRTAGIREARQVLEHLPGPGESLHAIVTARLDLTDVVNALLDAVGPCDRMRVAAFAFRVFSSSSRFDPGVPHCVTPNARRQFQTACSPPRTSVARRPRTRS